MQLLIGWLILLSSVIGHTELWVLAVNRAHAFRFRSTQLRKFRALHDLAVPGYPVLLLWLTGLGETSLLRGGTFSEQSSELRLLLMSTSIGCLPFLIGVIRWQCVRKSQFSRITSKTKFDVMRLAESSPQPQDIRGPRRHVSQLWPWNEIYHLEVNTKSVEVQRPRAQTALKRRLRLVHFSDLHFIGCPGVDYYRFMVRQAQELHADAYVFTGDLIDDVDLLTTALEVLQPLTKQAPCYFVLGNHDWRFDYESIRTQMVASGWTCVAGRVDIVTLGELRVLFAGSELPWMSDPPPMVHDSRCDLTVLLSHSPDQHPFAQRCGYDLMLSGHTHGGQVVLPVIGPVYSPSYYGVSFVSGLFPLGNLTMHVTRGVGAKDPMRWNCCPELTCVEVSC